MMATMHVEMGQTVIVTKLGKPPVTATVTHVTKTGQFKTSYTGNTRFTPAWDGGAEPIEAKYNRSGWRTYVHTEERFAELAEAHAKCEQQKLKEREAAAARAAEREEKRQRQISYIRSLVPDIYAIENSTQSPLPDGSRVYEYLFPSRPHEHTVTDDDGTTRNVVEDLGWLWAVVVCKNVEGYDWKSNTTKTHIEMSMTYKYPRSGSFSSVGTEKFDAEVDAVYEALRYAYYQCW